MKGCAMKCDVCNRIRPIVLTCMIGAHLCAECQNEQQRISYQELSAYTMRAVNEWLLDLDYGTEMQ